MHAMALSPTPPSATLSTLLPIPPLHPYDSVCTKATTADCWWVGLVLRFQRSTKHTSSAKKEIGDWKRESMRSHFL